MTRLYASSGNKYGAKRTEYDGVLYHSKREAQYAQELDLRQKAGDILHWRRQVPIALKVNEKLICKYILDFILTYPDGTIELVEVKGYETAVWKLKRKLLEAIYLPEHPGTIYTVVR